MAAKELRCKECGATYGLEALYVCEHCFGPLEVGYDHSQLADPDELKRKIQAGPNSIWRYSDFLPFARRPLVEELSIARLRCGYHAHLGSSGRLAIDLSFDLLIAEA